MVQQINDPGAGNNDVSRVLVADNPHIAALLSFGRLEIESNFAFQHYLQYLGELALLQSNVPFAELGISKRREQSQPALYVPTGQSFELVQDRYLIRNQRLTPAGSFALLKLSGVMTAEDQLSTRGARSLVDDLRAAYANTNIAGIIMETNSGGGEGIAMDMLVSALSERNKPAIGFAHVAASAAYGTLAAMDEIIAASPESIFGSIGAVLTINLKALEQFKAEYMQFYGENAPNKNREMRAAFDGDFGPIKEVVNKYTDVFQNRVASQRPLTGDKKFQRETLSGDVFNARESKQRGLIDGVGNMSYALTRAQVWAKKYSKQTA